MMPLNGKKGKHRKSAKLPWHNNMKLSCGSFSFCHFLLLSFCLCWQSTEYGDMSTRLSPKDYQLPSFHCTEMLSQPCSCCNVSLHWNIAQQCCIALLHCTQIWVLIMLLQCCIALRQIGRRSAATLVQFLPLQPRWRNAADQTTDSYFHILVFVFVSVSWQISKLQIWKTQQGNLLPQTKRTWLMSQQNQAQNPTRLASKALCSKRKWFLFYEIPC